MIDFRPGILLSSELCMIKTLIGEAIGTHVTIEHSGVLERRLSSRCKIMWA